MHFADRAPRRRSPTVITANPAFRTTAARAAIARSAFNEAVTDPAALVGADAQRRRNCGSTLGRLTRRRCRSTHQSVRFSWSPATTTPTPAWPRHRPAWSRHQRSRGQSADFARLHYAAFLTGFSVNDAPAFTVENDQAATAFSQCERRYHSRTCNGGSRRAAYAPSAYPPVPDNVAQRGFSSADLQPTYRSIKLNASFQRTTRALDGDEKCAVHIRR